MEQVLKIPMGKKKIVDVQKRAINKHFHSFPLLASTVSVNKKLLLRTTVPSQRNTLFRHRLKTVRYSIYGLGNKLRSRKLR